jgi:hypothetical protein
MQREHTIVNSLEHELWDRYFRTYLMSAIDMHPHDQIPVGVLHVLETDITEDTSVIDEDVDTAEVLDSGVDDFVAEFNTVVVGNSLAALLLDFVDHDICSLFKNPVVSKVLPSHRIQLQLTFVEPPSPLTPPPRSFTTTFAPLEP